MNMTVVVGYTAALLFGAMAYNARRVLQNIDTYEEAALAMFFLQDDAVRAMEFHALGGALIAIAVTVTAIAFATGMDALLYLSRPITVLSLFGFLYFYRTSARVTGKPGERPRDTR